jgi:hypothetical protein
MSDLGGEKKLAVFAMTEWGDEDPTTGRRRTRWTRIGRAFHNRDGSINILLDAFPVGSAKIQVREDDRERTGGERRTNGAAARDFETVEVGP